ncbi:hypothetical protein G6660_08980 [Polynucleobacter paneuropaeus]|nr:hypothetical protein [Polynucleobacter paneuropaeus]
MKNNALFRLMALTAFVAVVAIYFVLYPTEMGQNLVLITSVGLLAISVGHIFYGPFLSSQNKTNTARIGSIGITTFFSIFILLPLSGFGVYKAVEGSTTVANVLNIATIAVFFMQYFITKSSTNLLDDIDDASNFKSSHAQWGRMVNEIALTSSSPDIKNFLMSFSEEFKFLARDPSSFNTSINQSIDDALATLAVAVNSKDELEVSQVVGRIKTLLATREQQLKDSRSKV